MSTQEEPAAQPSGREPAKGQPKGLWSIVFTVFLDLVGIGIVIPVVAPLMLNKASGVLDPSVPDQTRNILLGFLIACYPVGQFFGAPILGALADSMGRKKILIASILGACLSYVLFAVGVQHNLLPVLFASRLLAGLMGGNLSVAYSIISDIVPPEGRTRAFGLMGASFGLGFIIGPAMGGQLSNSGLVPWFGFDTPFLAAALLSAVNAMLVSLNIRETLKSARRANLSLLTGIRNIGAAFQKPNLRIIFLVAFFVSLGFSFFSQFFQVYLIRRFDFDQVDISKMFAFIGVNGIIVQGGLLRLLKKGTPPENVLRISLLGVAIAFGLLVIPNKAWLLMALLPLVSVSIGFTNPNIATAVSSQAQPHEMGEVFGIQQSIQALGLALPPLLAGFLTNIDIHLPILMACFTSLTAWVVLVIGFHPRNRAKMEKETPFAS